MKASQGNTSQEQKDVDLLRGLAATHFMHGGLDAARDLLDLARLIKSDDAQTLVLAARVQAKLGAVGQAVLLMAEATQLSKNLPEADRAFARSICDRLDKNPTSVSKRTVSRRK